MKLNTLSVVDIPDTELQKIIKIIEVVSDSSTDDVICAFGSRVVGGFNQHSDLDTGVFKYGDTEKVVINGHFLFGGITVSVKTYYKIRDSNKAVIYQDHTYRGSHLSMFNMRTKERITGRDDTGFYRTWPARKCPRVRRFDTVAELNRYLNREGR